MIKITKREAKERFVNGQIIYLCPCKLSPHGPFSSACTIHPREWNDWETMYRNWEQYNASDETGTYAHYYKD